MKKLSYWMLGSVVLGIGIGIYVRDNTSIVMQMSIKDLANALSSIFIRLILLTIAPLIFTSIIVGINRNQNIKLFKHIVTKGILWFVFISFCSLFLGLFWANLLKPGNYLNLQSLSMDTSGLQQIINTTKNTGGGALLFVHHFIPDNLFVAFTENNIFQVLVIAIIMGLLMLSAKEKAKPLYDIINAGYVIIVKLVYLIIWVSPLSILGAMISVVISNGMNVFHFYGFYFFYFLISIVSLWLLLILLFTIILSWRDMRKSIVEIFPCLLIAFTTSTSESALPLLEEKLKNLGCNAATTSIMLPLGYSFNLDGSMVCASFITITILQMYHIHFSIMDQIGLLLFLMISSKGIAGIPRSVFVAVLMGLNYFHIPLEGVALLLPVDYFIDVLRATTNVFGNSVATQVVDKWIKNKNQLIEK